MRRVWRAVRLAATWGAALVLMAVLAAFAWRAYRHHDIAVDTAIDPATGIDEARFVRIGGIDQWISIRGQDRRNPVLLVVHGGPGIALSPIPRWYLSSWTKRFTVVEWDQRGAGKTYGRSGPVGADVSIERMARDGIEVAEFLRDHLHQPKIVLVGHSWGSDLGVRMVKARPDLFCAYVGTGQSVNQGRFKAAAYAQLLAEARRRRDAQAIRELESNGPPPYRTTAQAYVHTKWANAYEPGQIPAWRLASIVLFDSDAGPGDLRDYIRGITTSEDHFRKAVDAEDLATFGTDFALPVFIFQGALDNVTPAGPVREYFDRITAPKKELVLIPNAGHNAIATRSDAFLALLVRHVLPVVRH